MKNALSNTGRAARAYDNWISTDLEAEKAAARETAIEDKSIELYREMLDSPEDLAEALQEAEWDQRWQQFAAALGNALRNEAPSFDIQYLSRIKNPLEELLMDYSTKLAESWYEEL